MDRQMDKQMDLWSDEQMLRHRNRWADWQTEGKMYIQFDRTDGMTDGGTDG
jgi:hypothetical protein